MWEEESLYLRNWTLGLFSIFGTEETGFSLLDMYLHIYICIYLYLFLCYVSKFI